MNYATLSDRELQTKINTYVQAVSTWERRGRGPKASKANKARYQTILSKFGDLYDEKQRRDKCAQVA